MIPKNGSLTMSTSSLDLHMQDPLMDELLQDYAKIRHVYAAGIREITSRLEVLESEFQYRGTHNPIHHIESRVKTLASIVKKLEGMKLPLTIANAKKNMHDIAGVRVICCYVDDIFRIAEALLSQDDVSLVEKKDYIESPKENGYRSLHIVVDLPVYLSQGKVYVPVEIQIRTVAMDFWASLEHGIRYKSPSEVPSFINDELRACADIIAATDDRMLEIFKAIQLLNGNQEMI
jgi:putative GTP pyrophosphokinase